jgi:rhodanese-related sulfurtransferase
VCGASHIRALRQQEAVVLIDVRSDEEVAVSRLSDSPHDRAPHIWLQTCFERIQQWLWMRMRRVWMRMRLYRAHLPWRDHAIRV